MLSGDVSDVLDAAVNAHLVLVSRLTVVQDKHHDGRLDVTDVVCVERVETQQVIAVLSDTDDNDKAPVYVGFYCKTTSSVRGHIV